MLSLRIHFLAAACALAFALPGRAEEPDLQPLRYNHPGITVDLGAGLWGWPIPMDIDGDGFLDLVVVCPDTPSNGVWVFKNPGSKEKMPVFKPGVRISKGDFNISPSYIDGQVRILGPAAEYPDFRRTGLDHPVKLPPPGNVHSGKVRSNQWKYVDYDGDGKLDLVVGIEDWGDYGWDNAYDEAGRWTRGPIHGFVYWLRNTGDNEHPVYAPPEKVLADGKPAETFGMPSPNFVDFDGDGDLDLLCGEFRDSFTYFENIGTRTEPKYAAGRRLVADDGNLLHMDLEMIVVVAFDWTGDGFVDLIVGDEDGRIALIENTGRFDHGAPIFKQPRYFRQEADALKFGALVSPVGVDWDGDGLEDLICGNSAGYIGFIKNLGGSPPQWAAPKRLEADGRVIRLLAGPNGSIQGPAEAKWGYTTLSVADWDGDGLPDLIVNSIWGKILWFRNIGTRTEPRLGPAQPIEVEWSGPAPKPAWLWWQPYGKELVTEWRTTPLVRDFTGSGLNDIAILDPEGYLALFPRAKENGLPRLLPSRRVFFGVGGSEFNSSGKQLNQTDGPLRLNNGSAGASGRRKLCMADWDGDGILDLLANGKNADFFRGVAAPPVQFKFEAPKPMATTRLAGHDTSPTVVHWNPDGIPDLVIGAEDGKLYFLPNPRHGRR